MTLVADIQRTFAAAGVSGTLHAVRIDDPSSCVHVDADDPVVMASVYKLPVIVAFSRAVDRGTLDPARPVTLEAGERTPGLTGVAAMSDAITMSWRDLARSMITVSDNAAGDALLDALGLPAVAEALDAAKLTSTTVLGGTRHVHSLLLEDLGGHGIVQAMQRLADNDHPAATRALDPLLASATTARDMTRLLTAIWTDAVASPGQCAFMRDVLFQQIWPHRLASGFPYAGATVAGKTGTLGPLRHEVGVVQHRHEPPVAVAVFTRAARADRRLPAVDAAIGAAARLAVSTLR